MEHAFNYAQIMVFILMAICVEDAIAHVQIVLALQHVRLVVQDIQEILQVENASACNI